MPALCHFHPRLLFAGKAGAYPSGAPYDEPTSLRKKSFLAQDSVPNVIKLFTSVIYEFS